MVMMIYRDHWGFYYSRVENFSFHHFLIFSKGWKKFASLSFLGTILFFWKLFFKFLRQKITRLFFYNACNFAKKIEIHDILDDFWNVQSFFLIRRILENVEYLMDFDFGQNHGYCRKSFDFLLKSFKCKNYIKV